MDAKELKVPEIKSHECGCTTELNTQGGWAMKTYCKVHMPNYEKRAKKATKRRTRKRGRGYTKRFIKRKDSEN
jgi:hypothetical protein